MTFGRQGSYHTNTGRLQISTRAARQTFWVASLLAGSTSSRPFFSFLCNLRSLHDAQGTDARPCEVSHRYVKSPDQPLVRRSRTPRPKIYYNRPNSTNLLFTTEVRDRERAYSKLDTLPPPFCKAGARDLELQQEMEVHDIQSFFRFVSS